MAAYRFCRTDDVTLLVDALNRCWSPYFPDEPAMTPAVFKRSIRDIQVWCSSCMVASSGSDPIGVLIGAKRPSGTLVHKIAVHPDHRRQGHGRHMLASLGSKLAILGPPRISAEVSETLSPACELFKASGYVQEALLTDYVLPLDFTRGPLSEVEMERAHQGDASRMGFVIPVTVDDLVANGLLGEAPPSASSEQVHPVCWKRSIETVSARKDDIAGLAIASDERIEAYVLYVKPAGATAEADPGASQPQTEIVSLRTFIEDDGARLKQLLSRLSSQGMRTFRFPTVHPAEISHELLETLGFRPAGRHLLHAVRARSD